MVIGLARDFTHLCELTVSNMEQVGKMWYLVFGENVGVLLGVWGCKRYIANIGCDACVDLSLSMLLYLLTRFGAVIH